VIKDDPEEISTIIGKWKTGKEKGKVRERIVSTYRCSTIGRMKKKEKIIWWGITPTYLP
jgi:hypothetical protein